MAIKVLLLSKYSRLGASSRMRSMQYLPFLQSAGFDITVQSLFDDTYLQHRYQGAGHAPVKVATRYAKRLMAILSARSYDLIWIEYELFPYLPSHAERLLGLLGRKYVVDYDDAIFHNYDLSSSGIVRTVLGRKIDAVMHSAACVITGNAYLASRATAAGAKRVVTIPTVVDHNRYRARTDTTATAPVIGWIGSPSTQKYVVNLASTLGQVCRAHGARLMMVGATSDVAAVMPDIDLQVVPWSESSEADLIESMDIGIMPLSDGPWEKGKCGYKLIQYMACGVPVVASPVGVNTHIVEDSMCGLLACDGLQWQRALTELLASPQRRRQMGMAGRLAVEKNYSLQSQAPRLCQVFNDVIHGSRV